MTGTASGNEPDDQDDENATEGEPSTKASLVTSQSSSFLGKSLLEELNGLNMELLQRVVMSLR